MNPFNRFLLCAFALLTSLAADVSFAQPTTELSPDQLRGQITPERAWWDLQHYDLAVEVFPESKTIKGQNQIRFKVLAEATRMQIDLQTPLKIQSVTHKQQPVKFTRQGNVYWVDFPQALPVGATEVIEIKYSGEPKEEPIHLGKADSPGRKTNKETTLSPPPAKALARAYGGPAKTMASTNPIKACESARQSLKT